MQRLSVLVKPNSRVAALERQADGSWLARVRSPPVDGKANDELLALIARAFGVRKAQVSIRSGGSGRTKRIEIGD
jgi:uncharacterized protein (TIGR00251 family)